MTTQFHFPGDDADATLPKARAKSSHLEWTLMTACYVWSKKFVDGSHLWLSIDRGQASRMQKIREAARGFKAGTPDVLLLIPGLAVFQEIKVPGGKISDHQHAMGGMIGQVGHKWYVAWSVTDFARNLVEAGVPLRALALEYARAADEKLAARARAPKKPSAPRAKKAHLMSRPKLARARSRGIFI